jgi:hypothetical protein
MPLPLPAANMARALIPERGLSRQPSPVGRPQALPGVHLLECWKYRMPVSSDFSGSLGYVEKKGGKLFSDASEKR